MTAFVCFHGNIGNFKAFIDGSNVAAICALAHDVGYLSPRVYGSGTTFAPLSNTADVVTVFVRDDDCSNV